MSGALGCKIIDKKCRKEDAKHFPLERVFLTVEYLDELKL